MSKRPSTSGSLPRPQRSCGTPMKSQTPNRLATHASSPQNFAQNITGGYYNQRRAVTANSVATDDYEYHLPPRLNETLDHQPTSRKEKRPDKISLYDIEDMIRVKLRREKYALQCMFQNADSSGKGNVNKGALLKILYSICGHIRIEQFHQLLERYYLDELPSISFQIFEKCFSVPHGHAPKTKAWSGPPPTPPRYVSMAHAHSLLKSKLADGRCDIQELLPPSCFTPGGVVLIPHLKEALDRADIHISQTDFDRFWVRLDTEGSGAVRTPALCKWLGISFPRADCSFNSKSALRRSMPNLNGYHKKKSEKDKDKDEKKKNDELDVIETEKDIATELLEREVEKAKVADKRLTFADKSSELEQSQQKTSRISAAHLTQQQRKLQMLRQRRPKFDDIMDCLFYLFEESYNAMLVTFEHFDGKRDNFVLRLDFRNILKEYGFGVNALELDQFLSRIGVRSSATQVHYRDFLSKFQSKADRSPLNKIINSNFSILNDRDFQAATDDLSTDQLEAKVVEFLHTEFLKFVGLLQRGDQNNRGTATESFFRNCLEKTLGYTVADDQFENLQQHLSRDRAGNILFYAFLKLFDKPPNSWNRKKVAGREVVKTARPSTPPQLEVLKQVEEVAIAEMKADTSKHMKKPAFSERSFEDVCILVEDKLRNRFHQVDQLYKQMDKRNSGTLTKTQFGQILNSCGLKLTSPELDKLWSTLETNADGHWSYRALLRHFMTDLRGKGAKVVAKDRHERMKGFNDPNLRRLRDFRRHESAQLVQRKKQEEQRSLADSRAKSAAAAAELMEPLTVEGLCHKIRPNIIQNWEILKNSLRRLDQVGYATVKTSEMKEVLRRCNVNLLDAEINMLCKAFDTKKDGRFAYIEFLKLYGTENGRRNGTKVRNETDGNYYAAADVIARLRNQLLSRWETLLRAFKKLDVKQTGYLDTAALRRALCACDMKLTEDDLFLILTEFDLNLDNKIDYQEFVKQMLNVC